MGCSLMSTSRAKRKHCGGPPRGGMEDGPNRTDDMVTTGTNKTCKERILRECSCRWSKVTTYQGLQIHQGKEKCRNNTQVQACTATAGQTRRNCSQVEHHSATEPNIAPSGKEQEQPLQEDLCQFLTPQLVLSNATVRREDPQLRCKARKRRLNGRKLVRRMNG
ncbi:uncharacterized protein LOC118335412 [Tachysurus ichikawai]